MFPLFLQMYLTRAAGIETDFEYFPWNKHIGIDITSNETMDRVYPITIPSSTATSGVADPRISLAFV